MGGEESGRGKLVLTNQKGYGKPGGGRGKIEVVVVEEGWEDGEGWRVVVGKKESAPREKAGERIDEVNLANGGRYVEIARQDVKTKEEE